MAVSQIVRQIGGGGIVGAGIEQEHGAMRILARPGGYDGARGPGANDDDVPVLLCRGHRLILT